MFGARRRRKRNDRLDAEFLARQGRADRQLLYPVQHRTREANRHAHEHIVTIAQSALNHLADEESESDVPRE